MLTICIRQSELLVNINFYLQNSFTCSRGINLRNNMVATPYAQLSITLAIWRHRLNAVCRLLKTATGRHNKLL